MGGPRRAIVRLARLHLLEPLPAHVLAGGAAGEVGEEASRRVWNAGLMQPGFGDEGAHFVGADAMQRDVGCRVVAVRDHGLEHVAGFRRAAQVLEHAAADRADAVVDDELLGFREALGLHLLEVGREHEGLEGAATEQRHVGIVRHAPGLGDGVDVELRALVAGERQEIVEQIRGCRRCRPVPRPRASAPPRPHPRARLPVPETRAAQSLASANRNSRPSIVAPGLAEQ